MGELLNLVNEWLVRGLVLSSLAAYLLLILFAGVRRRRASGWRMLVLWPAYQVAALAANYALANLSLGSTYVTRAAACGVLDAIPPDAPGTTRQYQRLLYRGEDNVLAGRQVLGAPAQVVAAIYVLYKHIVVGGSNANAGGTCLLPASVIMFFLGIAKYIEGAAALWRGNLGNIRSSIKTLRPMGLNSDQQTGGRQELSNEQALLVAHGLLYVTKGAFADYSFAKNPLMRDLSREKEFSHGWKGVRKVVETELSLMYDMIMYTKATVVHTWLGYGIRVVSPLFTAAALSLFWLHSKDGQRSADVGITYILLVVTFILDVRWLLGALGSTWTYAFIDDRYWLRRSFRARWHGLRSFVVSLDPTSLLVEDPTSYRLWSGTIGRYNLLQECTHQTTGLLSRLVKILATRGIWMEYQYGYLNGFEILPVVTDLLFENVWEKLKSAYRPPPTAAAAAAAPPPPPKADPKPDPPKPSMVPDQRAGQLNRIGLDNALEIGPELQEVVLIWHIATEVFLLRRPKKTGSSDYVMAIGELSNYMMFVVAVRPHMLPGLKLPSLHEATRDALKGIWNKRDSKCSHCCTSREDELASILIEMEGTRPPSTGTGREPAESRSVLYNSSVILSDGAQYAQLMLRRVDPTKPSNLFHEDALIGERSKDMLKNLMPQLLQKGPVMDLHEMLKLIFNVWVRLLIHASIRCSRESHAKQLGSGGELTTIVWILAEHAAIEHQARRI